MKKLFTILGIGAALLATPVVALAATSACGCCDLCDDCANCDCCN